MILERPVPAASMMSSVTNQEELTARTASPFDGGGEMRARARSFDWSATSLGRVEAWSSTLATAVRMCMESPFPFNLWCGPERLLIYNDAYRRVLGSKHPGALGRPGLDVWAEIREALEPMFAHIDAGGAPIYAEDAPFVMARTGDRSAGELAYFTFGLSAIREPSGDIVGYFNPATETTGRIRAEEALAATTRRLDAALLAGEVGTFQWDIPDDRLWGDANFARIFGIQLDERGAAPLADYLAAIHPDDRERTNALVQHTLDTGAPYDTEYRIVSGREGGRRTRWVEARGRVEYDAEGRPVRFPGVVQDVTRRREAEEERLRLMETAETARREAELANRAKSQFLASMSHELRTPLNAIGGHAQLLTMEIHGPLTEAQRFTIGRIERAQRHLLGVITDILNYAKLESGTLEYDMASVSVEGTLVDVLPMVEPLAASRQLSIDAPAPESIVSLHVWADREKFAQVLLNLLSNAVKFTLPGGHITVEVDSPGGDASSVRIKVRDTGVGIPAERLEAIFEPFVQVERGTHPYSSRAEGTGLGLSISRELARAMGGDLVAESRLGKGSTFTLTLSTASRD
jgi:PAS domain S-box-containing protein